MELNMNDTHALLALYVKEGSEGAFGEIVSRYIDLVYSTALRQVCGVPADEPKPVAQSMGEHRKREYVEASCRQLQGQR